MTDKSIKDRVGERPQTEALLQRHSGDRENISSRRSTSGWTNNGWQEAYLCQRTILPLPPEAGEETRFEMEIYARFMRHLRQVPNSKMEIKILSAIQFTADMMDVCEGLVSKTLVDLGLLAPREAFPESFLGFCDSAVRRRNQGRLDGRYEGTGMIAQSTLALLDHWQRSGEDRYAYLNGQDYALCQEAGLQSV